MSNSGKDGFFRKHDDTERKEVGAGNPKTSSAAAASSSSAASAEASAGALGAPGGAIGASESAKVRTAERSVADAGENKASKLIVGPGIRLKGEISECDTIIVEGCVEAATDSRVLQVAQSGSFTGTVAIDVAEIHGRFEGELTARQKLVIYATGSVAGTIRYGKIVIEEGGEMNGDVGPVPAVKAGAGTGPT